MSRGTPNFSVWQTKRSRKQTQTKRLISRHGLRLKLVLLVLQNTRFARTYLEVNTDNTSMLCTKVVMNPKEKMKIKISNKGTVVNAKEYNRIRTDKIKEMREIYRRNRGQGGGRFRSR